MMCFTFVTPVPILNRKQRKNIVGYKNVQSMGAVFFVMAYHFSEEQDDRPLPGGIRHKQRKVTLFYMPDML